jgi:DMSO/TMAO reductase YedYZ heme-binding membrane subunit
MVVASLEQIKLEELILLLLLPCQSDRAAAAAAAAAATYRTAMTCGILALLLLVAFACSSTHINPQQGIHL